MKCVLPSRFVLWGGVLLLGLAGRCQTSAAKPPFPVAHEAPLKTTIQPTGETMTSRQFRVEFNGIQGDRVPGYLYLPKSGKAPWPAVLLQYGIGGNKNTDYIVEIGHQFVTAGFVVLTIDSPMKGERKHKDQKKPLLGSFSRRIYAQYCGDYSRAVDYLIARPDVNRNRIAFVGISWGAITGVTFAANDPRIKVVASLIGGGNFAGLLSGWKAADPKKSLPSLDPVDHVGRIAPRPLLMINVNKDQLVPRPCAEALHKAAGKGAKVVWYDTDHYFRSVDRTKIIAGVIEFVRRGLRRAALSNRSKPKNLEVLAK